MSIDKEIANYIKNCEMERYFIFLLMQPNKKYRLHKIWKKVQKCGIKQTPQRIAHRCNVLCDEGKLQKIYKHNKVFYVKPLDKFAQV